MSWFSLKPASLYKFNEEEERLYRNYIEKRVASALRYTGFFSALYTYFLGFRDYQIADNKWSFILRFVQASLLILFVSLTYFKRKSFPNYYLSLAGILFFMIIQVYMHFNELIPVYATTNVLPLIFFAVSVGLGLMFIQGLLLNSILISYVLIATFIIRDPNHVDSFVNIVLNFGIATGLGYYNEKEIRISFHRLMKLESINKKLAESNETKLNLLSIIAHDINSPLASLRLIINMREDDQLSKEEYVSVMDQLKMKVDSVSQMLQAITHWAKSQMGGFKPNFVSVSLEKIIPTIITSLLGQAEDKNIELKLDLSSNLEMHTDPEMLKVAIRNLISNAIKFSPSHSSVLIKDYLEDGKIRIDVIDAGKGMTDQEISNLFTYKSKSKYGTNDEPGTGLGLHITHRLISLLDGEIIAISNEGKGSTFSLLVPAQVNK